VFWQYCFGRNQLDFNEILLNQRFVFLEIELSFVWIIRPLVWEFDWWLVFFISSSCFDSWERGRGRIITSSDKGQNLFWCNSRFHFTSSKRVYLGKQKFDECKTNFVSIRPNLLLRLPLCLYLSCSCFERKGEKMSACLCLVFLFFSIVAEATYSPGGFHHLSSLRLKKKVSKSKHELPFETRYFPQNLDHFSFTPDSYKVFHQKYLINNRFWRKGGPIFVYTGNEGDIDWFASNTGFMLDIAPKFRALLVFIEVWAFANHLTSSVVWRKRLQMFIMVFCLLVAAPVLWRINAIWEEVA